MKKNQKAFMKVCLADALIKLMNTQDFDSINVSAICKEANIGRTTFYRYFNNKNSKEDLLIFKINYEWECYKQKQEDIKKESDLGLTDFIYENRKLFSMLYHNSLITVIMRVFEDFFTENKYYDKQSSYLMSFFTYGYFGIIYQWIKYGFDETPEQLQKHINDTVYAKQHNS